MSPHGHWDPDEPPDDELDARLRRLIQHEAQQVEVDVETKAMKAAVKEALRQFLDEKWKDATSTFGKWVIGVIAAAALAAMVYFILKSQGWQAPHP